MFRHFTDAVSARRAFFSASVTIAVLVIGALIVSACAPAMVPSPTTDPSDDAYAIAPEPGRTIAATPDTSSESLEGYRIALVVGADDAASTVMSDAAQLFATEHHAELSRYDAATPDIDGVSAALTEALDHGADVVIGVGAPVSDAFSFESALRLDQQFLLIGAQVAEPTANVTAVVWEGATSRGSAASADGPLDGSLPTPALARDAVTTGMNNVRAGRTGVVLSLPSGL